MSNQKDSINVPSCLKLYYQQLGNGSKQRAFVLEIRMQTEAHYNTVMGWIHNNTIPTSEKDREIISKITGIAIEDLWNTTEASTRGGKNRKV